MRLCAKDINLKIEDFAYENEKIAYVTSPTSQLRQDISENKNSQMTKSRSPQII